MLFWTCVQCGRADQGCLLGAHSPSCVASSKLPGLHASVNMSTLSLPCVSFDKYIHLLVAVLASK